MLLCFYGNIRDSIRLTETLSEESLLLRFNKGYPNLQIYFENNIANSLFSQPENVTQLGVER